MACQHFPDDQTLRLQAGTGEDDVIHRRSGLDCVDCERQEEEEPRQSRVSDLIDILLATLSDAWRDAVTAGTGLPGVWSDGNSDLQLISQE